MKNPTLFFSIFFTSTLALAEIHASFKNFNPGKDGMWETTTTSSVSPKPIVQKSCVDIAKSKAMVDKMVPGSEMMKQCKMKVISDTKNSAEMQQTCSFGPITTKMMTRMKKVNDGTFETVVDSETGGRVTTAKMISRYVGPCSETDKAAQSSKMTEQCGKCKSQVDMMKTKCKSAAGPEQQMCSQSIQQIETMCKASCP